MKYQKELVREANERKIVAAAELIFAQYGFKGATTERIAKQAGLPKANVHYYFKTKFDLYRRVLALILEEWMSAATVFDEYDDPRTALETYVRSKMMFSRSRPLASKVWANEILHGAQVLGGFLDTTLKTWLQDRVHVVEGWIAQKKIKAVDPHALFYMIWSTTQHYADFERQLVLLHGGQPFSDREYEQKIEQVVELILGSVGLN
ncbi:MAG: TetR/AcrR family transcriptional regulator [Exilibacterium sp.]